MTGVHSFELLRKPQLFEMTFLFFIPITRSYKLSNRTAAVGKDPHNDNIISILNNQCSYDSASFEYDVGRCCVLADAIEMIIPSSSLRQRRSAHSTTQKPAREDDLAGVEAAEVCQSLLRFRGIFGRIFTSVTT